MQNACCSISPVYFGVFYKSFIMDRFLVRTPREQHPKVAQKPLNIPQKQATIESLKGVVVIEEILHLKSILELEAQTTDNLVKALQELNKKIPSRKVLLETKIGHKVNKLRKNADPEVSKLAKEVFTKWKKYFKDKQEKPMLEVRCDLKTENLRRSGRKLLAGALHLAETNQLIEAIEREAFFQHDRWTSKAYRKTMRTLVFTLKHQDTVRNSVLNHEMNVKDFVTTYKKDS